MPKTVTVTLYEFDELSPQAKEKAREWWRDSEIEDFDPLDDEWIFSAADILGITFNTNSIKLMNGKTRDEPKIYWQLDGQGYGASFAGRYEYKEDAYHKIKTEFPQEEKLHEIATELFKLHLEGNGVCCVIEHNGRDAHRGCMDLNVVDCDGFGVSDDLADRLREAMRDFADWIYKGIQADYDYRMSNDCVDDAIISNQYTFREDGTRSND